METLTTSMGVSVRASEAAARIGRDLEIDQAAQEREQERVRSIKPINRVAVGPDTSSPWAVSSLRSPSLMSGVTGGLRRTIGTTLELIRSLR